MNQQKGFSLIEVLLSLVLMSTTALAVLAQQQQSRQLISQLVLSAGASLFLDQIDELLVMQVDTLPKAPFPYELNLTHSNHAAILHLDWLQNMGSKTRDLKEVAQLK